jgi:trk system potassium uptake protein TrkH
MILMISGGCAASVAGGFKIIRVAVIFKLIRRNISRRMHPSAVVPIKFDGKPLAADTVSAMAGHAFLFAAVLFAGIFVICLCGYDITTSASGVIACVSNTGSGMALEDMNGFEYFNRPAKAFFCPAPRAACPK